MTTSRNASRRLALRTLYAGFPHRTVALGVLAVLAGALPALFAALVGALIAVMPNAVRDGFGSTAGHRVILVLVGMGVLLVVQELVSSAKEVLARDLYRRFDAYVYARVMRTTMRWPDLELFDDPDKAAQVDRARRVSAFGPGEFVSGLSTQWEVRATGAAAAVLLAVYLPYVAIPLAVVWYLFGRALQLSYYRSDPFWSNPLRRAEYLRRIGLMPEWAKELRIFGLVDWIGAWFSREWMQVIAGLRAARRSDRRVMAAWTVGIVAANAAAVALIARSAWSGALSIGALAVAVQAVLGMASLAAQDGDVWMENGAVPMPDVAALQRTVDERPAAAGLNRESPGPQHEISFEGVEFCYPGRDTAVYDGFDLRIQAGTSLAIVGLNGAGKTTLAKLLAGLCRPDGGRITVDGVDLADIDTNAWRRSVAAIFQDFVHYELPARDNVTFGAIEAAHGPDVDGRVLTAIRQAGATDVVDRLPDGLDTVLSRRFTGGVDISGGQWQRLALARALLATQNGARVLVLDEPTAHLDVRAEVDLFDRFLELTQGLTTILISHRFSTVRRAHRIVVLEHGRVVEDGSHDDLVAADGRYARMFRLQAERYTAGETESGSADD